VVRNVYNGPCFLVSKNPLLTVTLNNELEAQISEAFCIFDTHGDKYIDTRNVGNVLRFLGCVPTEKEVEEVVKATESTDYPGETHILKFIAHVSQLLMDRQLDTIIKT